jgi:hypothetical protein
MDGFYVRIDEEEKLCVALLRTDIASAPEPKIRSDRHNTCARVLR